MKVMVRVPNWVGDAVMAEPALRELRRIFREAHLTFVARPWVAGLFEGEGLADAVIPVNDARGLLQSSGQFINEVRRLRRERFDYTVLLQNAFRAALTARAAGVSNIIGYPTDGRRALLHVAIPLASDYKTRHQVFYYLNIAAELERRLTGESRVDFSAAQPQLHATDESRERAKTLLMESGFGPPALRTQDSGLRTWKLLAINPGATNSRAKRWLAERFAATADKFYEQDGFLPVIIGAASDREAADEVKRQMRAPAVLLAGKTSIAELKAVLSLCKLAISNDTGAAHVAAALGVPTVTVFGPTEDFATRPLSLSAAVVRHDVECSPCMLKDCPIDHRCMTRIAVVDVYAAAKNLLSEAGREAFEV